MLTRRDPHADLRQHAVEAHGVEQVPARERTLDGCREAREVLLAQADSRDVRKSAHDREREDVVVVHRHRRTVERALDHLAVDDDDLAAEVVDAPEPEVPDRARFGDAQARLVGAGEQRVDHGELRHGGTGHRRRSHHRWSVPALGGHDESRNSNARSAARACCGSEPFGSERPLARLDATLRTASLHRGNRPLGAGSSLDASSVTASAPLRRVWRYGQPQVPFRTFA